MSTIIYDKGYKNMKNWIVSETKFDQRYLNKYESIFTQGNGYIGLRNSLEEQYVNEYRGLFISGVYDQVEGEVSEIVNLPDVTFLDIYVDGQLFSLLTGKLINYHRDINLKNGEVKRLFTWVSQEGKKLEFEFRRFVSNDEKHLIVQKMSIRALDKSVHLRIETGIDSQVTNRGVQHIKDLEQQIDEKGVLVTDFETKTSNIQISYRVSQKMLKNNNKIEPINFIRNKQTKQFFETDLVKDDVVTLNKKTIIATTRDIDFTSLGKMREQVDYLMYKVDKQCYETLLLNSTRVWKEYWLENEIKIDSTNEFEQLSIRFALYHLAIMTNKKDNRVGIGAKGLSGEEYKAHSFWDTEIFIQPMYSFTEPLVSKNLLNYRYLLLDKAKEKALQFGFEGAMFPWEAAWPTDGEVTERFIGIDRETGKPMEVLTGEIEIHVVGDIIFALKQYLDITGDISFMDSYGYEMVLETAVFWMSRSTWNETYNRYDILNVIGPDEYKEEIDNNAYTNYLAHFNLNWAINVYEELQEQNTKNSQNIINKTNFSMYFEKIKEVAEKIYLPEPDEITQLIKQNETYLELESVDLTKYEKLEKGSIHDDYSMNELKNIQVSKQADLLMLFYLFSDIFSEEVKRLNYDFYEKKTIHDSTLSLSVHSIVAIDIGYYDEAYKKYLEAGRLDLGTDMKSSDEGIHSASLGMLWQNIINGFSGVRVRNGQLTLSPNLPKTWTKIEFNLVWQNMPLKFQISDKKILINNSNNTNFELKINDKVEILAPNSIAKFIY